MLRNHGRNESTLFIPNYWIHCREVEKLDLVREVIVEDGRNEIRRQCCEPQHPRNIRVAYPFEIGKFLLLPAMNFRRKLVSANGGVNWWRG